MAANLLTNPTGVSNNGSAWTGWIFPASQASYTASIVPGVKGSTAQRLLYTGTPGNGYRQFVQISAAGTFAPSDPATFSCWIKVDATTGCSVALDLQVFAADGTTWLGTSTGTAIPAGGWVRVSHTYANLPALTSRMKVSVQGTNIHAGDTFDITIDGAKLEKSATATPFAASAAPNLMLGLI
jgi:hypothetical protein